MSDINLMIVSGTVDKAPDVRTTTTGKDVTSLTVVCTENWPSGERKEYVRVVGWGEQSKELALLAAGDTILIQGRWSSRSWESKDGTKQHTTEVVARNVSILGGGGATAPAADTGFDDVFPF